MMLQSVANDTAHSQINSLLALTEDFNDFGMSF